MTIYRLRLLGDGNTIQEDRWIRATTRNEAQSIARRVVKVAGLCGFELWREDCCIHAESQTGGSGDGHPLPFLGDLPLPLPRGRVD